MSRCARAIKSSAPGPCGLQMAHLRKRGFGPDTMRLARTGRPRKSSHHDHVAATRFEAQRLGTRRSETDAIASA